MTTAFMILALITLAAAVMVVVSRQVVHGAMYLIVSFLAMAGIFIILGAEFVAAVQIIVYAGSIIVLFVFVSMTVGYSVVQGEKVSGRRMSGILILGGVILAELVYIVTAMPSGSVTSGSAGVPSEAVTRELGRIIFTDWLLPFEILSLIILAAMVGIAALRREEGRRR